MARNQWTSEGSREWHCPRCHVTVTTVLPVREVSGHKCPVPLPKTDYRAGHLAVLRQGAA